MCILGCTNQLRWAMLRLQAAGNTETLGDDNGVVKSTFNVTAFVEVCAAVRPPVQCYDRCPSSDLQRQLHKSLDALRYMCIAKFEDIKNNGRCLAKMAPITQAQCAPRCRRYEAAVNRTKQLIANPYARYMYTPDQIRDMLSGTCQNVQCNLNCSVPLTRASCGDTAAELVSGVTQKLMASVQNYDRLTSGGQVLPPACQRLAQPNGEDDGSIGDGPALPRSSNSGSGTRNFGTGQQDDYQSRAEAVDSEEDPF